MKYISVQFSNTFYPERRALKISRITILRPWPEHADHPETNEKKIYLIYKIRFKPIINILLINYNGVLLFHDFFLNFIVRYQRSKLITYRYINIPLYSNITSIPVLVTRIIKWYEISLNSKSYARFFTFSYPNSSQSTWSCRLYNY